jgi:hypothetical protein
VQNLLSSKLLSKNSKVKIYRSIILPAVFTGVKHSLPHRKEKCKLRLFENGVVGKIFEPKRDEVAREWGRLHNKGFYDLHTSTAIIGIKSRRISWTGHVACMGKRRGKNKTLVGRHEGRSLRGKT